MMREIGGYFELELNKNREFHPTAIKLNLGRNALEYILIVKDIYKIYLPYYICDVVLEPIKKLNINFEYYQINSDLEPEFEFSKISDKETFLYVNYFGLKEKFIHELASKVPYLIIDNSQAFFSKPISGVDCFYSARKFFGVPDGAYLYSSKILEQELEEDISGQRLEHLTGRIEYGASKYYNTFLRIEESFSNIPLRKMSRLTRRLLMNVDYDNVAKQRKENFWYLHDKLYRINELNLDSMEKNIVPMVYPLLLENGGQLKNFLIKNHIYIPTYWESVKKIVSPDYFEYYLTENLIPLPIDQRYTITDMNRIIKMIEKYLKIPGTV